MVYLLILLAFPSTFGGKGIYRVKCADVEWLYEGRSTLVFNIDGEGFRYEYPDTTKDYGSTRLCITYTPSHNLETYMLWRTHLKGRLKRPFSSSEWTGDIGDTDVGIKNLLLKSRNVYLGTDLSLTLPVDHSHYSNNQFIFYPKLLGTYDLGPKFTLFPLRCHFNLGIPIGRNGLTDNFPLTFGLAGEINSKFLTYFMELTRNHERDWNWRISPGIKFHPFFRLTLSVVADFGIVKDYRVLGANVGLSINSTLVREREVGETGNIAGEIKDKYTNVPISAKIKVLEIDETYATDKDYGVYKIIGLPTGVYTLKTEIPNYATETKVVVVESNRTAIVNFSLSRSLINYEGIVFDLRTNQPVSDAKVYFDGKTKTHLTTDVDGTFNTLLIPGEYEIKINKENYSQLITNLTILQDCSDTLLLKPIEVLDELPDAVVYFDFNDAHIRDDQKATLDKIAEFLKRHSAMRCELRGHTDQVGDINYNLILSEARANSVKDYFVKTHGLEKERFSVVAFSKTKLVKEGDEFSRRVEIFLIRQVF